MPRLLSTKGGTTTRGCDDTDSVAGAAHKSNAVWMTSKIAAVAHIEKKSLRD
jgi:hypothetical protein